MYPQMYPKVPQKGPRFKPKNALGKSMLKRLKVYSDETRLPEAQLNSLGSGTTEEKKDLVEE